MTRYDTPPPIPPDARRSKNQNEEFESFLDERIAQIEKARTDESAGRFSDTLSEVDIVRESPPPIPLDAKLSPEQRFKRNVIQTVRNGAYKHGTGRFAKKIEITENSEIPDIFLKQPQIDDISNEEIERAIRENEEKKEKERQRQEMDIRVERLNRGLTEQAKYTTQRAIQAQRTEFFRRPTEPIVPAVKHSDRKKQSTGFLGKASTWILGIGTALGISTDAAKRSPETKPNEPLKNPNFLASRVPQKQTDGFPAKPKSLQFHNPFDEAEFNAEDSAPEYPELEQIKLNDTRKSELRGASEAKPRPSISFADTRVKPETQISAKKISEEDERNKKIDAAKIRAQEVVKKLREQQKQKKEYRDAILHHLVDAQNALKNAFNRLDSSGYDSITLNKLKGLFQLHLEEVMLATPAGRRVETGERLKKAIEEAESMADLARLLNDVGTSTTMIRILGSL